MRMQRPRRLGYRRWLRNAAALAVALACTLAMGCAGTVARTYEPAVTQALDAPTDSVEPVGDGRASFSEDELAFARANPGYEDYSELDVFGRCGEAEACLGPETMPGAYEERESIWEVKPTGWQSARYDFVDGESLYNRCHLIAWSLSAENANPQNLVTGTRHMNAEAMLGYEEAVARYIDRTGNHVLYRATPIFEGTELVCRAIELEAESLEDGGAGVSFNVVCLNVQPGIEIDYRTGDNWEVDEAPSADAGQDAENGSAPAVGGVPSAAVMSYCPGA